MTVSGDSSGTVGLRHYHSGDHEALATIFTRAVRETASADYGPEQVEAWAPDPPDVTWWRWRAELKRPFIGTFGGAIAGFLELDPDGHVDCAYVSPDYGRRGVMRRLLSHAIDVGRGFGLPRLYAEVSITARPAFTSLGFVTVRANAAERRGVTFTNYLMERRLDGPGA